MSSGRRGSFGSTACASLRLQARIGSREVTCSRGRNTTADHELLVAGESWSSSCRFVVIMAASCPPRSTCGLARRASIISLAECCSSCSIDLTWLRLDSTTGPGAADELRSACCMRLARITVRWRTVSQNSLSLRRRTSLTSRSAPSPSVSRAAVRNSWKSSVEAAKIPSICRGTALSSDARQAVLASPTGRRSPPRSASSGNFSQFFDERLWRRPARRCCRELASCSTFAPQSGAAALGAADCGSLFITSSASRSTLLAERTSVRLVSAATNVGTPVARSRSSMLSIASQELAPAARKASGSSGRIRTRAITAATLAAAHAGENSSKSCWSWWHRMPRASSKHTSLPWSWEGQTATTREWRAGPRMSFCR
mmetsp:Transcript_8702/g.36269  ORF Transcript_8702/g.36269 Transcript_8702/m.36269 type:complete len:371 (-) Transcript_8702:1103-2215(-)